MVVKQIDGRMVMMVGYWDAGYVQLDVTDPANPTYITDTKFDEPIRCTGFDPPEGNAHQGEFSHDNQFLLAADEDFAPDRDRSRSRSQRPERRCVPGQRDRRQRAASTLADGVLDGPTDYGGYGCAGSAPVPDRGDRQPDPRAGREAILRARSAGRPTIPERPRMRASRGEGRERASTPAGTRS